MEFEKTWIIMEKSWNFVKFGETTSSQKTSCRTLACLLVFWLLVISSFNYFKMYAWSVYKHAFVAAFRIYAQRGEDAAKRGGWRLCIK